MNPSLSSTPEPDAQPPANFAQSDDLLDDILPSTSQRDDNTAIPRLATFQATSSSLRPRRASQTKLIVPDIASNQYAAEPCYFVRPNRYFGPPSTWRSWTEAERGVAESLDIQRNQNLSIHLYNAFALKRKAAAQRHTITKRRKGKAKVDDHHDSPSRGESEDGALVFAPPDAWTAWPMPPEEVPRDSFQPCTGLDSFRPVPDLRPSAALEECLIATTTRIARERWEARDWQVEFPGRDMKVEHEAKDPEHQKTAQTSVDSDEEASDTDSENPRSDASSSHAGVPMFSSQAFDLEHEGTDSEDEPKSQSEKHEPEPRPVPISDDTRARQLILPSTRHIISKLDDLLLGLHKARQAYAKPRPQRSRRARSSSTTTATDKDETTTAEDATASTSSLKRKRKQSQAQRPNLRDWSDVLGMASLTGWKQSVVDRAAKRCAALFNENMLFRTFHSGSNTMPNPSQRSLQRPLQTLPNQHRAHSFYTEHFAAPTSPSPSQSPSPGPSTSTPVLPSTRLCPHPKCERHSIPFKTSYALKRHIDRFHSTTTGRTAAGATSTYSSDTSVFRYTTTDYETDAITNTPLPSSRDTIICPVRGCKRNSESYGFSRGARMYEHLRRRHPEVDVESVKRLERDRRGERRGRWTDERRRSISRTGWEERRRASSDGDQMEALEGRKIVEPEMGGAKGDSEGLVDEDEHDPEVELESE